MGHQAVDNLTSLFTKATHDLAMVQHRLEREFQQTYPDNANPVELVSRIKKIQEDLSILRGQCQELLAAKQDLIDKAQRTLVGNRKMIQKMQASARIPQTDDSDDPAYANFNQVESEVFCSICQQATDIYIGNVSHHDYLDNGFLDHW